MVLSSVLWDSWKPAANPINQQQVNRVISQELSGRSYPGQNSYLHLLPKDPQVVQLCSEFRVYVSTLPVCPLFQTGFLPINTQLMHMKDFGSLAHRDFATQASLGASVS